MHALPMNRSVSAAFSMALGLALVVGSACEDKRRHRENQSVELGAVASPVPRDAEPVTVVRALTGALRDAQSVRETGFRTDMAREQYDRAMATLISLAADSELYQAFRSGTLKSRTLPGTAGKDALLTTLTENWVSIVAYYAAGIDQESVRQVSRTEQPGRAKVTFFAERPSAKLTSPPPFEGAFRTLVVVQLRRRPDGSWGVFHVTHGKPPPAATGLPLYGPPTRAAPAGPSSRSKS